MLDEREYPQGPPAHLPAWLISDVRLLWRAPLVLACAVRNPGWLRRAAMLDALAQRLDLPSESLTRSVARFNQFYHQGVDEDFHREQSVSHANGNRRFHVGLQAIQRGPFIAVPFNRTYLATKGGPRTDEFGRVVH